MSLIRVLRTDYNPLQQQANDNISKKCYDNLLHVRLRDYVTGDVISGVVDKISFLITYLYQSMMYVWKDVGHNELDGEILEKCYQGYLENLFDTNDMSEIVFRVKEYLGCDGIKVLKKYTKPMYKTVREAFGMIEGFKFTIKNDTLMKLLDNLGLTLKELLLNDGIELIITDEEDRPSTRYEKYINRKFGKQQLEVESEEDCTTLDLWFNSEVE